MSHLTQSYKVKGTPKIEFFFPMLTQCNPRNHLEVSQREVTPPSANTAEANWLRTQVGKRGKEKKKKRKDNSLQTEGKTQQTVFHSCGAIQARQGQQSWCWRRSFVSARSFGQRGATVWTRKTHRREEKMGEISRSGWPIPLKRRRAWEHRRANKHTHNTKAAVYWQGPDRAAAGDTTERFY